MGYEEIITTKMPLPASGGLSNTITKMLGIGGTMPNPMLLPALIGAGSNLLGGILGGIGKSHAVSKAASKVKPTGQFIETYKILPQLQEMLMRSIVGRLSGHTGDFDISQFLANKVYPQRNTRYSGTIYDLYKNTRYGGLL